MAGAVQTAKRLPPARPPAYGFPPPLKKKEIKRYSYYLMTRSLSSERRETRKVSSKVITSGAGNFPGPRSFPGPFHNSTCKCSFLTFVSDFPAKSNIRVGEFGSQTSMVFRASAFLEDMQVVARTIITSFTLSGQQSFFPSWLKAVESRRAG